MRSLQRVANITDSYDVILTRSNAIAPDPRVESTAQCLSSYGFHCLAVGWDRDGRFPAREKKDGFDVVRFRFRGAYGGGVRNMPGLACWNIYLLALHLRRRPKVIHAYDLDTIMPALLARLFLRCKVVYDVADWYAASRRVGCLRPLFDRLERWACRKADLVILAHEKRLQQIGFVPRKWLVLYNTPRDIYGSAMARKAQPEADGYFAYIGVLHSDRGIDTIIEAASTVGARLIIAGFGPLEGYCRKAAATRNGIEFLGQIPYEKALQIEGNAIAIIALYDPRKPNNRFAAPNKLYEAMMLGRPLITTKGTLVGEVVERERIGIAVTYGDFQELSRALSRLRDDPVESSKMGRRARALYETQYSYDVQCQRLRQAYQELCPGVCVKSCKGDR